MKKISFIILFFFVAISFANDNLWKPTNEYYLQCSYKNGNYLIDFYAYYDSSNDKKIMTSLFVNSLDSLSFVYEIWSAERYVSDDKHHKFHLKTKREWSTSTSGTMDEYKYNEVDYSRDVTEVVLDREKLTLHMSYFYGNICNIIDAEEYKIAINKLENKRDALIDNFVKERSGKLKL